MSHDYLLDDDYHTSPKMKHYKNDKVLVKDYDTAGPVQCFTTDKVSKTVKSTVNVYTDTNRSNIRTLDNFFKINGPAKKAIPTTRKKSAKAIKQCPTLSATLCANKSSHKSEWSNAKLPHSDCIYDLSNDTNDSEQTNFTDELLPSIRSSSGISLQNINRYSLTEALNFTDNNFSNSTNSIIATDNIFLQEPVLTLNVDKTPNQASSIKINKSIELEPKFASHACPTTAIAQYKYDLLNNCSTQMDEHHSMAKYKDTDIKDQGYEVMVLPENDNSSCDSGVVFVSSSSSSTIDSSNYNTPIQFECKPTTPHRIVWPSPRRDISPEDASNVLLPRKSQRHSSNTVASSNTKGNNFVAINGKTRRKLTNEQNHRITQAANNNDTAHTHQIKCENNIKVKKENGTEEEEEEEEKFVKYDNEKKNNVAIKSIKKEENENKSDDPKKLNRNINAGKSKCTVTKGQRTAVNGNRSMNEFFPVRRSARKTKTAVKEEMMRNLELAILEERCDGLRVEYFDGKGRGVVAERHFQRGEFVIEYVGDLISITEATEREARYAMDENAGCYMYYFEHRNQQYCIDATEDTGKLGRLVNHSRYGNLLTKVVVVKQVPHLILVAKKDIVPGDELCYDYGDRSKDSLRNHPWLAL